MNVMYYLLYEWRFFLMKGSYFMESKYKRLELACYTTNISMSVVGNLSPVLFLTFHTLYDISYSLLGFLVMK